MSDQPLPPSYPVAPPTRPGALPVAQPVKKWPTVLGVVGIIVGVLGVLGSGWGLISFSVMPDMMQGAPGAGPAAFEKVKTLTIANSIMGLPVAVLLLVIAIGLVTRRRWSISTIRVWAVLRILIGIIATAFTLRMQDEFLQGTPAMAGPPGGLVRIMQAATLFLSVAWSCTLPIFVLVWLSRAKIKAEVAAWR